MMAAKLGFEVGDRLVATLERAVGDDGLAMLIGLILVATSARRKASACAGITLLCNSAQRPHLWSAADAARCLPAMCHLQMYEQMLWVILQGLCSGHHEQASRGGTHRPKYDGSHKTPGTIPTP